MSWNDLLGAWETVQTRFLEGLAALTAEQFAAKAPFSPRDRDDETIGSLLGILVFHQSYHVGQLGVLRRAAGLEGSVK